MPAEAETGPKTHHFSSIDTWKHPDRNYFNFIVLSVIFGLFGLDHFYIRSFKTGGLKILINICGLGIWYFWDLIQIFNDSKKVRAEGLDAPFDWFGGIGRGVFVETGDKSVQAKSYKDFFVYGLLTIFLGFIGAEKFYLGDTEKGLVKMLSILSIYPILIGLIWVIYDIYVVIFAPQSIMEDGIITPFPFSVFPWLQKSPDKLGDMFIPKMIGEAPEFDYEAHQKNFGESMLLIWNWPAVKAMIEYYSTGAKLAAAAATATASGKSPVGAMTGIIGQTALAKTLLPPAALSQLSKAGQMADMAAAGPSAALGAAAGPAAALQAAAAGPSAALGAAAAGIPSPSAALGAATAGIPSPGAALGAATAGIPSPSAAAASPGAALGALSAGLKMKGGAWTDRSSTWTDGSGGSGASSDSSGPVIAGTLAAIVLAGGLKAAIDMFSHGAA